MIYTNGGDDSIWTKPKGVEGSRFVGSASEYVGIVVHLTQKMVVENTTWYQFSIDGKEIGWVESKLFDNGLTEVASLRYPFDKIVGQDTNDGIWSSPYGVSGGSKYVASSNVYSFDTITITAQAKINGQKWYAFRVDGKHIGWIHDKAFDNGSVNHHGFALSAKLGNSDRHAIWTKPYGLAYSKYVAPISQYAYEKLDVINTVSIQGTKWGQIKNEKGIIGWIDLKNATKENAYNEPIGTGVASVKGNLNTSHGIWTKPYGEEDAKWVAPISDYNYKPVKILQKVKIWPTTWCKIQIGDRVLGWVDSQTLSDQSVYEKDMYVVVGNGNGHAIWSTPYGLEGARNLGNVSNYANNLAHVDKSMKIDRTEWYHVNIDGRDIGWFDSRSISTYSFERNGVYHVATNDTSHGVWSKPYGVKNAAWIDSAVAYKNKKLVLKMYIHLGDTYWYAFDNGHGGVFWIDKDVVRIGEAK
ncbi:GW domain-containing glycosaminoglycan-binding protein [Bacillus sp. S10(2024)]|uniref:GW domain-containing glycosaminoglycan-binding protein n=1 Tax=Bacillus sp. S10(2024) TaxID=3162886 RepID=UPI003D19DDE4